MPTVTVYFDYLCPFAWRGLELLSVVAPHKGFDLDLRHYSLVQGNHADNAKLPRNAPAWKLVEQPLPEIKDWPEQKLTRSSLLGFLASHAAAQQGKTAHLKFALELFRSIHQEKTEVKDTSILTQAAQRAGLDVDKFQTDFANEAARRSELGRDLEQAGELAVFGTPTVQLPSGNAAYFRFAKLVTEPQAAVALWDTYVQVLGSEAHIETIKRPRK